MRHLFKKLLTVGDSLMTVFLPVNARGVVTADTQLVTRAGPQH
jgi:hypothetical protein